MPPTSVLPRVGQRVEVGRRVQVRVVGEGPLDQLHDDLRGARQTDRKCRGDERVEPQASHRGDRDEDPEHETGDEVLGTTEPVRTDGYRRLTRGAASR
jgi:hypothetical protein